jgi:F-type H+-transporting ATPase subunit gamma
VASNYRAIYKRIGTIAKTRKIVQAMKMVSAAKFARATRAIERARPYAQKMREVVSSVASGVEPDAHPLLRPRERVRRLEVVLVTGDRGLCGAYNTNLGKYAEALIQERLPSLERATVVALGRKGAEFFRRRRHAELARAWSGIGAPTRERAAEIAAWLSQRYLDGEADEVVLIYSQFQSALVQRPAHELLLPFRPEKPPEQARTYEVEPGPEQLLGLLVPSAIEFAIYRALLEEQAGEHGARMTAMDNASKNTEELIRSLTLEYNKARQSAITAELVEIVSGAEAL